jgi:hypothetical protein
VDKRTQDFIDFHAEKVKCARLLRRKHPSLEESHKSFKIKEKSDICSGSACSCLVSVSMSSKTVGFATTLNFHCHGTPHSVPVEPQKVSPDFYAGTSENCHGIYWVNYLIVMFMHRIGCGMYHAQLLAGLLGLPSFFRIPYMFRVVEDKLGPVIQKVSADSKEKAIVLERDATKRNAAENNKDATVYDEKIGISVSSDTRWPHRGGGGQEVRFPQWIDVYAWITDWNDCWVACFLARLS